MVTMNNNDFTALLHLSFCGIMSFHQLRRFFNPNKSAKKIKRLVEQGVLVKKEIRFNQNKIGVYQLTALGIQTVKKIPARIIPGYETKELAIAEFITRLYEHQIPYSLKGLKKRYKVIEVSGHELYVAYIHKDLQFIPGKKHILIGPTLYDLKQYTDTKEFVRFALEENIYQEDMDRLFFRWDGEWIREINAMFRSRKEKTQEEMPIG